MRYERDYRRPERYDAPFRYGPRGVYGRSSYVANRYAGDYYGAWGPGGYSRERQPWGSPGPNRGRPPRRHRYD